MALLHPGTPRAGALGTLQSRPSVYLASGLSVYRFITQNCLPILTWFV